MRILTFISLCCVATVCYSMDVELLQETTVDTNALTFADGAQTNFGNFPNGITHQQFPLRTYRGYQYAVYYDDDRQVCVGRRKLPAGAWEVIRLTDYTMVSHDTHNVAVLGICENDGTIHLTFDHHRSDLNYRVSVTGLANDPEAFAWDASLFGTTTDVLGPLGAIDQVTYPRFVSTPGGDLLLYYRYFTSGNGDGMLRMYDGTTSQWTTSRGKFIARDIGTYSFGGATSNFRYSYLNGIGYAGNRLHVSWVWRDLFTGTSADNQHDLCYAYSDDDGLTWKNSAGTQIGVTGSSFINVNSPGLVVSAIDPNTGLSNQTTQYAYPDGGVHVILRQHESGTTNTRYHHHWRDAAGNWNVENLGIFGRRPELVGDEDRNLFIIYTSGTDLRILKGVPNAGFTAWTWAIIYDEGNPSAAGDGQIDPSRWESERVLSIYHQERPSVNGLPSPLHVTDFQVALRAAEPEPAHEDLYVSSADALTWTAGLNAVAHRIYVGTDSNVVATATTNSPAYKGEQSATDYTPTVPFSYWTTYYWRINEVQAGGTVIQGLVWKFSVRGTSFAGTLNGDGADCSIKETPAIEKLTDATVDVGARGSVPRVERCTIYVFSLPDFGTVSNPFSEATFSFDCVGKNGTLRDYDLYGLGRRASSTVLTSDFYSQTSTPDPTDASRLQTDILTDSTPVGLVSTSAGGSSNLVAYLNAEYAGGAGAGEYVFLRINSRAPKSGISYATLTMSEGGVAGPPDTRPRITYQAVGNSPPYMSAIADQTIPANTNTGPIAFIVGDDAAPGSITLTGSSSNPGLVPVANIVFGGGGSNRTVTVTPAAGQDGDAEIFIIANDGVLSSTNSFTLTVLPPPPELIAGWDTWDSTTAPGASYAVADVTASATASAAGSNWSTTDGGGDPGRGSSDDTTWGTFDGGGEPASANTTTGPANFTAVNGVTDAQVTFTIENTGSDDITLDQFHFDAVAFRPNAPRTYSLNVLAGSDITVGNIFTSSDDAISSLGGGLSGHDQHDDIDLSLTGLADYTLAPGEIAVLQLAFSSGTGSGGGHHLFLDNVALTGSILPVTEPPVLDYSLSGSNVEFSWSEAGFKLQVATNDLPVAVWSDVSGGDSSPVTVTPSQPMEFFRLAPQ